ncbi:uncharacterized protein LOC107647542 [Arachis ipaensis]|uniref:uncharacterized protein LOC107647542 n=1 Tax=Arachis ipaensis TaxID=130454 RepID=UPI0007AF9D82|nr:uncharacterized protein LOC107647542 [Arachis ipaensis]XP_025659288.1 uncharacterized protein LOC112755422 [Arachis hypogaea]
MMCKVQHLLESMFKLKVLGDLKYFLGLELARLPEGIVLSQRKYTLSILEDTNFVDAKPSSLPMETNLRMSAFDGDPLHDPSTYRRIIRRLMYLTISRPDITYAVSTLSQFLSKPTTTHLTALHHLLRYLKGSVGQGLLFSAKSELQLMAYANADWAGCPDTRRSVTGYCVFIGDSLISWRSKKKQHTVSRSSAESEYRAMAAVAAELTWLKGLLSDFQVDIPSSMLFCDSQSAIHIATNPTFHERTKHIEIDCHFVRERVMAGFLNLLHVRTQYQLADVFTKPVTLAQFNNLISKFGMINIYLPT